MVKVWNIRNRTKPLVRDLLECQAPVSFGGFSPDSSKLVIGDSSGRVFLLSTDDDDDSSLAAASFAKVPLPDGTTRMVRRPKLYIRHAEPPPPSHDEAGVLSRVDETGVSRARDYVASGHIRLVKDPTVGAVQGPNYQETNLYRSDAHFNEDPAGPLLARFEAQQQENQKMYNMQSCYLPWPPDTKEDSVELDESALVFQPKDEAQDAINSAKDFNVDALSPEVLLELGMTEERLLTEAAIDMGFEYDDDIPEGL